MTFQDFLDEFLTKLEQNWELFLHHIPNIMTALVILIIGLILARYIATLFKRAITRRTSDPIMINFLTKTARLIVSILVIMYALNVAGLGGIATGLLTAAGASAVIIGFAFRDIGENFISGVILSFNRPFNVNDTVSIGDIFGKVKTMEFRYTKLKTFDGRDVYIPNSDVIKKPVFNYTEDGFFRLDFIVGIAYEDRIEQAEALILQTIRETEGIIEEKTHEIFVAVDELAASTINLKVFFWVKTFEYRKEALAIRSDVIKKVKEVLVENGLNLPADIREIKLYNGEHSIPVSLNKNNIDE